MALPAHARLWGGDREQVLLSLQEADAPVRRFDPAPYFGTDSMRFVSGMDEGGA